MDLVIEAPRRVAVLREGAPPRPERGQVLVEVKCVSLCGSDYRLFDGTYGGPKRYPIRFGHEWAGVVLEAPRDSRLKPGTRVTGDCSRWCGQCDTCAVDKNLCRHIEKFGITCDGFSTRYRAVEERYLYPDEDGLDDQGLALAEPFAVALHGVKRAQESLSAAASVLVIGAGSIGLATYLLLKHHYGIRNLEMAESHAEKLDCVRARFPEVEPAAHGPLPLEQPLTYGEVTSLARHSVVFECSGSAAGLNTALLLASMRGTVVCFGMGAPAGVRTDLLVSKGLTLPGSIGGTGEFPEAMRFLARQRDAAARMVTHSYPASRAQEALEITLDCRTRIKTQLLF